MNKLFFILAAASLSGTLGAWEYQRYSCWFETLEKNRAAIHADSAADQKMWDRFYLKLLEDFPELKPENLSRELDRATRFPVPEQSVEIHVSPQGDDRNPGTPAKPLKTPEGARDLIRAQRKSGILSGAVKVLFHAGIYRRTEPFRLQAEDSGSAAAPVVYAGAPGETAVFDGGFRVNTPWIREGNRYRTRLENAPKNFHPRQLFVNGVRAIPARYPNFDPENVNTRGWLYHARGTMLLAGLSEKGDWAEFEFDVPKTGKFEFHFCGATSIKNPGKFFRVELDGKPVDLSALRSSGHWRRPVESVLGTFELAAGKHKLKVSSTGPNGALNRMHLGNAFFLSKECRVNVDVARQRTGGYARSMELTLLPAVNPVDPARGLVFEFDDPARIARWQKEPQRQVFLFGAWGWFSSILRAGKISSGADGQYSIELLGKEDKSLQSGNRFYLFNLLCELDSPGEWYYDYRTRDLYYQPRPGEDVKTAEFVLPQVERLVEIVAPTDGGKRIRFIQLKNLSFRHTDYSDNHPAPRSSEDCAVLLENAWQINVEACRFEQIGGYAVRLSMDTLLCRLSRNLVQDAGAGGFLLRGPWVSRGEIRHDRSRAGSIVAPTVNLIADNEVAFSGKIKKYVAGIHNESRPAAMRRAPGNVFAHNLIHDMPRNGIFGFWNLGGYVVEYNRIYRVMSETDDGGLIHFCAGNVETSPALIRNNLIHDTDPFRNDDLMAGYTGSARLANAHGVYLDDYTSSVTVRDNVISGTRRGGVFLHRGRNNAVLNNVILNDDKIQLAVSFPQQNRVERNLFLWKNPDAVLYGMFYNTKVLASPARNFRNNLFFHHGRAIRLEKGISLEAWRKAGADAGSVVADPKIVRQDLAARIFELSPDSPAFKLGFKAIDLSRVGIRGEK